jgi:photosystem II stability/assembly factor-like uncharacterized protein
MQRTLSFALAAVLLLWGTNATSQRWISALPQKAEQEYTVQDFQQAFNDYYNRNAVDLKRDNVKPKFIFQPGLETVERVDIDEYKMFKRWEWFTEPRTYPSGKWDLEMVETNRKAVFEFDKEMIRKQPGMFRGVKFMDIENRILAPLPTWTPMGPSNAVGGTNLGRINCIEIDKNNNSIIYIGTPDGGVWKSTNGGSTWLPKFDNQATLSVGDIAIDPNNSNIIYASTSDAFGYGNPFWGGTYSAGILKSINGGSTWAATGLTWTVSQNRTIRRLVAHPSNSNILMAATSNGLYRTTNAGATWSQIWATSTFDVEFQHNNGNIAYATTTQVHKSTNAGVSFVDLPANCAGSRYNIEIARSNTNTLYTLCTNGTVQKSTNAGVSWVNTAAPGATLYGYYDNVLAVSPTNANTVYVAGFNIRRTTNGGTSWAAVPTAGHVDNHCIEFLPNSNSTIFCGNDGGLFKTINSGTNWSSLNNGLAITQFYRLGISKTNANIMLCGAQDNGNMKFNTGVYSNITNADGMENFVDWNNGNIYYCGTQNGNLLRSTNAGVSFINVSTPHTGAWVTPWCQHPTAASTIFAGTARVYKSTNQGTAWTDISGALPGVGQFTTLAVAKSNPKTIYAGNGSKLYKTTAGGGAGTWTDITAGLPVASNVMTYVAVNDNNPLIAYVTFSGYVAGQKVYKTINGGTTWTNISGTLPNMPANCIVYENNIKNALYVGTDAGVYYIKDGLADWVPYKFGMPNVIVDELEIHYGTKKIRAATYGRGIWSASLRAL